MKPAMTEFEEALALARAALTHLGTGELRTVLVREGGRTYSLEPLPPKRLWVEPGTSNFNFEER
jgi:hypothetical protein